MAGLGQESSAAFSQGKLYKFSNCRLLRDHEIIVDDLWVRDKKILNPEKLFFDEQTSTDVVIDCHNLLISPGFIDTQINGAFGYDFSVDKDNLSDDLLKVAKGLLEHGVTSFCPTIVTSQPKLYRKILPQLHKTEGSKNGAGVLGLHLEGPFICKEMKGAHKIECITELSNGIDSLHSVYGNLDDVAIVTLAPELPGATEVIKHLNKMGIVVSLGHSCASLSDGEAAVQAGASLITHLFNAMLPFHHRDPHLVGLLSSDQIPENKRVYYGMITDGIHTHPAALRIAHRTHPKGLVIVTDAISAMGLPSGMHHLANQLIEIKDNKAFIAGTQTLCGSIASMNQCVQYFYQQTGCDKIQALESASLHPALLLGITARKGTLDYNTDADFILLDDQLTVKATFIAGELVWKDPDLVLEELSNH